MGIFFSIPSSLKQLPYISRMRSFCRGSADFFIRCSRTLDFNKKNSMTKTPSSHIVHKTSPTTDGSLLLTEIAKSLIGVTMPNASAFAVAAVTGSAPDNKPFLNLPNQENSHENPIGQNGRNGIVSNPKNRNHRLNCIRLDKQFLSARFAMKRMPVMAQRSRLSRKKRIPNSAIC